MRRQIPSTTALLCFEAAARTESFVQAAEAMNMTQSALSRQIKLLEEQVRQPLFDRVRQRVKLTSSGRLFWRELVPQLEKLETTVLRVRTHDHSGGSLNLGIYPTLGSRWLMPIIAHLSRQHPEITFNTITYLNNAQLDASNIDIAIVQGDPSWPGFDVQHLMDETLVVVASPDLLKKPTSEVSALWDYPILQHETRPQSWNIWLTSLEATLETVPGGPKFSQFEMLIEATKKALGIALVPRVLVERELADGSLIKAHPHECTPKSAYYVLVPNAKHGIKRIELVRKWLVEEAGCSNGARS